MKRMKNVLFEMLDEDLTSGDVLRGLRLDTGLSQDQIEELTGIKRSNISALENGRLEMTSHYAEIFSAVFNVHPAEILYPNNNYKRPEKYLKIQKKAKELIKKRT